MNRTLIPFAAGGALLAALALVLGVYGFRPTPGAVFLVFGWLSIVAAGYLLVRSVSSFRLTAGATAEELDDARRLELEREKKLLLKAIKEVEFDRDTGKLDGGEAEAAIARYRARAVEILRQLDVDVGGRYQAIIEKELARRLEATATANEARVCAACATVNDDDATFCKKCGARLGTAAS